MFDLIQHLRSLISTGSPTSHALRGVSTAFVALTAIANLTGNRQALFPLLRFRDLTRLKLVKPSRNSFAIVVFIGVFRYLQRTSVTQAKRQHGTKEEDKVTGLTHLVPGAVPASVLASALSTFCLAPESRPALVSLLSTNAASKLFRNFLVKNPDFNFLAPLELLVFMAAGGWIFSSGFFYPESYEPSHMKQILKNVVLPRQIASELQEKYRQGFNPNPCIIRHKGLSCRQFARSDFLQRVVSTSLRVYAPVHLTAWLLSQRHAKVRARPATTQLKGFVEKLTRSSAYSISYVYLGWLLCCQLGKLGDRSLTFRKLQFFLSGAVTSVAIFFESPSRRHSIGLILTSYALVSAGNVTFRGIPWLRPCDSSVRGLLEAGCVATAMSITILSYLKNNHLLRRILLGDAEARAVQVALQQEKNTASARSEISMTAATPSSTRSSCYFLCSNLAITSKPFSHNYRRCTQHQQDVLKSRST